jgi:peptidoglycan/xylan/chitin deacetylase (PgdA/CDA1 family)
MGALARSLLYSLGVLLYWVRLHRFVIWWNRRHAKVLLYHACEYDESDFTRGLRCSITPACFAEQLDYLKRNYQVVPLAVLQAGDPPDRAVSITFDDGYRSVYEKAFPALKSRGLAATVYLVTDVVSNGALVWVNELNYFLRRHGAVARPLAARTWGLPEHAPPEEVIARATAEYDRVGIRALLESLRKRLGITHEELCREVGLYLDWEQIDEMRRSVVTFGNHTMSHPNLAALSEPEQREEIIGAQEVLLARLGNAETLSYPFGCRDETTSKLAKDIGFKSVVGVGGSNLPLNPRSIARIPVLATTNAGLFSQMEIVEPTKARIRRWFARAYLPR